MSKLPIILTITTSKKYLLYYAGYWCYIFNILVIWTLFSWFHRMLLSVLLVIWTLFSWFHRMLLSVITSCEIKRTMSKLPIILTITSCEIKRTMSKLPIILTITSCEIPFLMGTVALGKAFCFYRQWIYCVCPAMLENPKQLPNFTEKIRNKNCSYQGCPLSCPCLYCYHFLPSLYHLCESGTSKALLVPWL
jgi:hypothetical protein